MQSSRNSLAPAVPRRLTVLSVLTLIGFGANIYLTQLFYQLRGGTAGFKSICNLNSSMNCDAIAASRWAEFLFGIPLSSLAAGWLLGLFFVSLFARNPFWRRDAIRAALGMTVVSCVLSVVYFFIMAAVIKSFCLFCLVVDVINFATLGILLSLKPEGFSLHKPDTGKFKNFGGILFACLLVVVIGMKLTDSQGMSSSEIEKAGSDVLRTAPLDVGSGPEYPTLGATGSTDLKNAKFTIVEFSDFQCPFCKGGALILNALLEKYPGQVKVVFRNFPLDSSCNAKAQHTMHPYACEAAKAAHCAFKQGKFDEVYQDFFENQANMTTGWAYETAKKHGLDEAKFKACTESSETMAAITKDTEEGARLGITSTPTFFINGRKWEGAYPVPAWSYVFEHLP